MKNQKPAIQNPSAGFDMFRLSKSKEIVDVCSNTLRAYNRAGLPFYRAGKAVFVSRAELDQFIRSNQPQLQREAA
jgi:NurA-like 5'-3' nuclease